MRGKQECKLPSNPFFNVSCPKESLLSRDTNFSNRYKLGDGWWKAHFQLQLRTSMEKLWARTGKGFGSAYGLTSGFQQF